MGGLALTSAFVGGTLPHFQNSKDFSASSTSTFRSNSGLSTNNVGVFFVSAAALAIRAKKSEIRRRISVLPTEYYGLFGLPLFTSDPKEIKAAHRRVVKLVHPDITGADSGELQVLVTEAYNTLSDDDSRAAYDEMLRRAKPTLATSQWSPEAPSFVKGVFVDETKCEECYRCVNIASSTFAIHTAPSRQGKAYVALQYGDDREVVKQAIAECPMKAITYVSREDLPKLEFGMQKCATIRQRAAGDTSQELPGPWDIYQDLMIDELIGLDMQRILAEQVDPFADSKMAEAMAMQATRIAEAAAVLSESAREKLWPQTTSDAARAAQAFEETSALKRGGARRADSMDARGVQRAEMKGTLFHVLDRDGDGFLFDEEFRAFATDLGFEGTDDEWETDYQMICKELNCSALNGIDLRAFSRLLDDEGSGCALDDRELAQMLSKSGQLPRAGG